MSALARAGGGGRPPVKRTPRPAPPTPAAPARRPPAGIPGLYTGARGPDGDEIGPGKTVLTSGKSKGLTQFSLPSGQSGPFLEIFSNGDRRFGFYDSSGNTHGTTVYMFRSGDMSLGTFRSGTGTSSFKVKEQAVKQQGQRKQRMTSDHVLPKPSCKTLPDSTKDAASSSAAVLLPVTSVAESLPSVIESALPKPSTSVGTVYPSASTSIASTVVPAIPFPGVHALDSAFSLSTKAHATDSTISLSTSIPSNGSILNDWDCSELGGVLLSMKIAPGLVKILVENSVSGMMVAEGIVTDEDLRESGIAPSLQRKAVLTAFKKLRDMRASGASLAVLLDPEAL